MPNRASEPCLALLDKPAVTPAANTLSFVEAISCILAASSGGTLGAELPSETASEISYALRLPRLLDPPTNRPATPEAM